jgi:spore coat protein A, manganese oxidase
MLWYHDHAMGMVLADFPGRYQFSGWPSLSGGTPPSCRCTTALTCGLVRLRTMHGQSGKSAAPVKRLPIPLGQLCRDGLRWVFGDCFLANGKLLPYCEVEPRLYRFRIFNASNARFCSLGFSGLTACRGDSLRCG